MAELELAYLVGLAADLVTFCVTFSEDKLDTKRILLKSQKKSFKNIGKAERIYFLAKNALKNVAQNASDSLNKTIQLNYINPVCHRIMMPNICSQDFVVQN